MENQHRKIKGYRELNQEEIDLMNRYKEIGEQLESLFEETEKHLGNQAQRSSPEDYARICLAEPNKWLAGGKEDIQTGLMKAVRAIAQPTTF